MFEDGAANTFCLEQAEKNINEAGRKLKKKINVAVMPLRDILGSSGMEGREIDLMSVDVEGWTWRFCSQTTGKNIDQK